jgi:hypothetical protein
MFNGVVSYWDETKSMMQGGGYDYGEFITDTSITVQI